MSRWLVFGLNLFEKVFWISILVMIWAISFSFITLSLTLKSAIYPEIFRLKAMIEDLDERTSPLYVDMASRFEALSTVGTLPRMSGPHSQ